MSPSLDIREHLLYGFEGRQERFPSNLTLLEEIWGISNDSVYEKVIRWLRLLSVGSYGPNKEVDCVCAICKTFHRNLDNFGSLLPSVNSSSEPQVVFGNFSEFKWGVNIAWKYRKYCQEILRIVCLTLFSWEVSDVWYSLQIQKNCRKLLVK